MKRYEKKKSPLFFVEKRKEKKKEEFKSENKKYEWKSKNEGESREGVEDRGSEGQTK